MSDAGIREAIEQVTIGGNAEAQTLRELEIAVV